MTIPSVCPLCSSVECSEYARKKDVVYFSCGECGLVFMGREWLPSLEVERERYSEHNNVGDDPGYVKHLMDIGSRVASALVPGASGLDYGCGPGPVMAAELRSQGFACASYDPIFADDRSLLAKQYDFVTCCEAVEHFHRPDVEFIKLYNLLKDGGVLGIKTSLLEEGVDFERWYYANDWTHVCFFAARTIEWIAHRFMLDIVERDVGRIVFRKLPVRSCIPVVAGIIAESGRWLVARRSAGSMAGKWEFPGGKLRDGETDAEALVREMREELELTVEAGATIGSVRVPQGGRCIELRFVQCTAQNEPGRLADHSEWQWVEHCECRRLDMPPGDLAFVEMR